MQQITLYAVVILISTDYDEKEPVVIKDENGVNYAIYTERVKAENFRQYMEALFPDETYLVVNSGLIAIE